MPLLAVLAVLLSAAMVLTVWSVMGGFLNMLLASGKSLMGDVLITYPVRGIPWYEDLLAQLEDDPAVAAATPTVEAPGLLKLPDGSVRMVQVVGVEGTGYDKVTGFRKSVWWRPPEPGDKPVPTADLRTFIPKRYLDEALALTEPDPVTGDPKPAVVLGVEVSGYNKRNRDGTLTPRDPTGWWEALGLQVEGFNKGAWIVQKSSPGDPDAPPQRSALDELPFLIDGQVTLSVLPLSQQGVVVNVEARRLPVANEFRTDVYEVDANTVLFRLDALQAMLGLDEARRVKSAGELVPLVDLETGQERFDAPEDIGVDPARATSVLVAAAPGVTPSELKEIVKARYETFAKTRIDAPPAQFVQFYTWQERPGVRTFVAAVKKETGLVLGLFGFISLTAVFLVFAIFWAMVSEKTKDVGVLRAVGASRQGVARLFLGYGFAIGLAGGLFGVGVSYLIVWNINAIHEWIGRVFHVYIWDPSIYYFTEIPNKVDPLHAIMVLVAACLFSVLGALAPAVKAARMDPVRALRFE